jgi:lipid A 3-O-deacylase
MICVRFFCLLALLDFTTLIAPAQAIDNTQAFRNIQSDHYFRVYYENDFFTGTDRDYTQGILLEWVNPSIRHFPLTHLLWRPKHSMVKYGLALENNGYTPNHLDFAQIQYGDHPYAGVILLKTFLTAVNTDRHERVSTTLSTGLIGPWAGDEDMQKDIHHWIHYIQPLGWGNQIKNDIALDYQVNYEREFLSWKDYFSLSSYTMARAGTLSTKASAGITAMLGNFYSSFSPAKKEPAKKIQFYVYDLPACNVIGYDATLQGGLFDRSSVYTIPEKHINRITFVNRWGIVVIFRKLYLEYYQSGSTREFSTSVYHKSGGLQIGFGF